MIPQPTSIRTAQHYVWGEKCDGWRLVHAAGLNVIEERMPPGTQEQRHWHARAMQVFYVLSGTLTLEVEGVRHQVGPRTALEIPSGMAHQAFNASDADVEFLVISMPPAQADRHKAD